MAEKLALIDKDLLLKLLGRVNPQPPINPSLRELSRVEDKLSETLTQGPTSSQAGMVGNLISKHDFHKANFEKSNLVNPTPPPRRRGLRCRKVLEKAIFGLEKQ